MLIINIRTISKSTRTPPLPTKPLAFDYESIAISHIMCYLAAWHPCNVNSCNRLKAKVLHNNTLDMRRVCFKFKQKKNTNTQYVSLIARRNDEDIHSLSDWYILLVIRSTFQMIIFFAARLLVHLIAVSYIFFA